MNRLSNAKRAQILNLLCEGISMRAISRLSDVSINTVAKLLGEAGEFCTKFHDTNVRGFKAERVQVDEIWSFVYAKQQNVEIAKAAPLDAGDVWTWTAIDADTKLLASWFVGDRTSASARVFIADLKERVTNRMQLTSDGHHAYLKAVERAFGDDVDYAVMHKIYGPDRSSGRRYSPPVVIGVETHHMIGDPDPRHVSTSYAERQNLTMRMHMRRFTRLTNAFSKKFENHCHMIAIYAIWYNWIRSHKTLRVTPAMAAGLADRLWTWDDFIALMDTEAPKPGPRGPYKKKVEA